MSSDEKQERYERAYQKAMEIIDQTWLDAGYTREDLEQSKQLAEIFDMLLAEGRRADDILDEWENKSAEDILREYAPPAVPAIGEHPPDAE
jgi:hypothetical protein